jgi:glycogen debranching enzyme
MFYIPHDKQNAHYTIKASMVRVRGMYKDVVFSPIESEEYRLRPNVLVAMTLAPELFVK